MSITPDTTHAKVGDLVVFTIVAENYGPGNGELWVQTEKPTITYPWNGYANCGDVNESAPSLTTGGANAYECQNAGGPLTSVRPGDTVTDTLVVQIQPTGTGSITDTACVESPDVDFGDHGCKTSAPVTMDSQPCLVSIPGQSQTLPDDPLPVSLGGAGHTYTLEGEDTFTKPAPLGSFVSTDMNQVVYTGDHGMGWTEYPDGWPSTHSGGHEGYSPSTVQSVHDGYLDYYLHTDSDNSGNSYMVGASISPLPGGHRYQTYGAWSFCERVPPSLPVGAWGSNVTGFHQAPLLWPQNDSDGPAAESDFPESDLGSGPLDYAYAHHGSGAPDTFEIWVHDPLFDPNAWHVYTQAWGPGFRRYYVDDELIGTSTNQVWSGPERWQLQIEPTGAEPAPGFVGPNGDVYVKWVWIGTLNGS